MGFLYWRWAAIGLLMGMLGLMIALGLGRRRGTRLHSIRIGLWIMVVTLGGAGAATTGCEGGTGGSDAASDDDSGDTADTYTSDMCYLDVGEWDTLDTAGDPDADVPDTQSYETCYADMGWETADMGIDTTPADSIDDVDSEEAVNDDAEDDGEDAGEADSDED